jgi:hypothetical protein
MVHLHLRFRWDFMQHWPLSRCHSWHFLLNAVGTGVITAGIFSTCSGGLELLFEGQKELDAEVPNSAQGKVSIAVGLHQRSTLLRLSNAGAAGCVENMLAVKP